MHRWEVKKVFALEYAEVLAPRQLCCPFCEVAATTLQILYAHIISYFVRAADVPLLQVQRRYK